MKRIIKSKGATMVEYALMVALVAIMLIALVVGMRNAMGKRFAEAGNRITSGN